MGLIIDNFAGGGGASTGLEAAFGRPVDVAINHDEAAIAVHAANHPGTRHYCQSIYSVDPLDATEGRPVALVWFSPDCKHHSKAKGGKPRDKYIRDLAHVVPHWIERLKKATPGGNGAPAVIMLENVEEFRQWGPLDEDNKPIKERRGEEFDLWVRRIRKQGYKVEWRELRACDYGVPTSRKRLFLIARRDGLPIVWPAPTHGKPGSPDVVSGKLLPWRTAAECIDWTLPCPSIFDRKRPLKDATCRRIAAGVMRYVVNSARPFIVPVTNSSWNPGRAWSADEPLRTITTAKGGEMAAVAPVFARTAHGERDSTGKKRGRGDHSVEEPFPTVTASRDSALIGASLLPVTHQGGDRAHAVHEPFRTITGAHRGEIALQSAAMLKLRNNCIGSHPEQPIDVISTGGHHGVVAASLVSVDNTSTRASRSFDVEDPLRTVTASGGGYAAVGATLIQTGYGEREGQAPRAINAEQPLGTIVAGGGKHAAVAAFLAQHNTGMVGHDADKPVSTITGRGTQQQLVQTTLIEAGELPADVMDRAVQVAAFLKQYYEIANERRTGKSACSRQGRADRSSDGRDDLASSCRPANAADCTSPGGKSDEERIPHGCREGRGEAVRLPGTSPGLDGAEGSYPSVDGHQSSGWREEQQLARQPRIGNPKPESSACLRHESAAASDQADIDDNRTGGEAFASGGSAIFGDRAATGGIADKRISGSQPLESSLLLKYYGSEIGQYQRVDQPLATITVKPRFAVVTLTIDAVTFVLVDIGMRMLEPRELARAQGFPESYILDPECWYRTDSGARKFGRLPKTHQIAKIGNSVCPGLAEALARANLPEMCAGRVAA